MGLIDLSNFISGAPRHFAGHLALCGVLSWNFTEKYVVCFIGTS